ncbi:hypothetical protein [Ferrimonas pelagia]|uniref:N-acetyltransferase domain-containing protein n=1 Tax=Ferrimonas pelagia TaxID=1177826 RepID=A0ABP9FEB3_9GAMM
MRLIAMTEQDPEFREVCAAGIAWLRQFYWLTADVKLSANETDSPWQAVGYYRGDSLLMVALVRVVGRQLQLRSWAAAKPGQGVARPFLWALELAYPYCTMISLWCVAETGNVARFERLGFVSREVEPSRLFVGPKGVVSEVRMERLVSAVKGERQKDRP